MYWTLSWQLVRKTRPSLLENSLFSFPPGNTAVATINMLKEWGIPGENIKFVGILGVSDIYLVQTKESMN
jgi:hypothetical protein